MPRIRCPKCDARVHYDDDPDRSFVRCDTCRKKIPLDDDDRGKRRKSDEPGQPSGMSGCIAGIGYAIALVVALVCVGVAFYSPGVAIFLAALFGVVMLIAAGIGNLVMWFSSLSEGFTVRMKRTGPWMGLMVLALAITVGPMAILTIAQKAGWVEKAADAGADVFAKGPPGGDIIPRIDVEPEKKVPLDKEPEVKEPPKKEPVKKEPPKKEPPKFDDPLPIKLTGDAALDAKLTELDHQDGARSKAAADSLIATAPNEHRGAVASHVAERVKKAPPTSRTPLLRVLGAWGTPQEVPMLIGMLGDADINTRNESLQALGKLKDERAVAPMVRCLLELRTQSNAEQSLKAMGPIAETEVLTVLNQKSTQLRNAAIRILAEIGTQKSVPALEEASKAIATRSASQKAIAAINARSKK